MKKIILALSLLVSAAAMAAGFELFNEYRKRDQMKITPAQGNVVNFLEQIQFSTQKVTELETIGSSAFVLHTRTDTVCGGDAERGLIICRNALGYVGMNIPDEKTLAGFGAKLTSTSALVKEFQRRELITYSPEEQAIIAFLKLNKYELQEITQLELMDPPTSFVIRNMNNDICLGDLDGKILRCKNEMGLTGVTFQGDSD